MSIKQDISHCLKTIVGENGVDQDRLQRIEKEVISKIDELKNEKLKLFDFSDLNDKTDSIKKLAKELSSKFKFLYILGTGGATLCGQTVCGLLETSSRKSRLKFIDNIDPKTFSLLAKQIKAEKSFVLVISKSGNTLETITQFAFFAKIFSEQLGKEKLKEHFLVITDIDNENNKIRNIANKLSLPIQPHEKVGGRFSIYSSVALIPAAFAGLKIKKFLKGAADEVKAAFNKKDSSAITGTALNLLLCENGNINTAVIMPYVDRLKNFNSWWAQIWAESLGKNNIATTPVRSLGTLDQHSQMQLFLQGKKDKVFNIIYIKDGDDFKIELDSAFSGESLDYINGKRFSNIINSAARAAIETLALNKCPVRVFEMDTLDEYSLGRLTMHFVLETVLLAKLWSIDPFDQPAVEQGKKLTVEMLKKLA